ncbi:hypothetical protein, partial [Ruminococcus bicirculans (ex Wegman et al. 2014)]|uniref:hypothetical protein n=1 Tax=Ruminococcus TaxID=1263 RepID=UPI00242D8129
DILKPVGFHIEEIHGLCCAFFYSAFFLCRKTIINGRPEVAPTYNNVFTLIVGDGALDVPLI